MAYFAAMRTPEECAQAQLDAYNARDIDAFAAVYHDDVVLFDLKTAQPFCSGIEALRERYGAMFEQKRSLHCQLVNRMVCGTVAIDEEHVHGLSADGIVHAIAIYETQNGLITKAWFVR